MCGRFALTATADEVVEHFALSGSFCTVARYNIAPGNMIPVIRGDGKQIDFLKWGLIPTWAKTDNMTSGGFINARMETIVDKPAFKSSFLRRRCLIPVSGYYEWQAQGDRKQPYYISAIDDRLLCFAGIWDSWTDPNGQTVETCAMITMPVNASVSAIHERMPVILKPNSYHTWLDRRSLQSTLLALLASSSNIALRAHAVSTRVNDPRYEHPTCLHALS
jgi:putative SOS response-associated peptidase YedK